MKIMKKILLPLVLSCLAIAPVRADVVFTETFNYIDGVSFVVGTNNSGVTNWFRHSGTASDSLIRNKNLQVGMNRQDDVNRPFNNGFTNSVTNLYVSFTINCTNLPTAPNYFAHFFVNSTTFHGKAWNAPGSLPGTWKLGVTTLTSTAGQARFFPVDLATNTDYQVVMQWDATQGINAVASIWVNPISPGSPNTVAGETVPPPGPTASTAFGFRQPGSAGGANHFNITNLVVATTFDEAATNVWSTNAVVPVMVYSPKSGTNFVGSPIPVLLTGVAAGQGLGNLTYKWLKNGALYLNPDGNTNTLLTSSAAASDSGAYQLVATTSYGLSVTSAVANLWVTNALIPPTITTQPTNTTVYFGQAARLYVSAFGPGTITYQWNHFGTNLPGETAPVLTIPNVQTNNGTTGGYTVGVTNQYGGVLSSNAVVSGVPIPAVSIAFLRTLVDANYISTNNLASGPLWQATGTVTTFTNLTTGNTSSYYMQDGTAGINIFATFAQTFRPAQGDVVTFVGVLSSFNSTLELVVDSVNIPGSTNYIVSNNNPLPAPKVIPFNITNNLAFSEGTLEGRLVMLTNVFFGTNAGNTILTNANMTVTVTNGNGEPFNVFFSFQDQDTAGKTLPSFASSVIGPMTQNLPNANTPRNAGYNVTVTRFSDIVTDAPPTVTASISASNNTRNISWTAIPYNYSYSVLTSTNVGGPYAPESTFQATMLGVSENPPNGSIGTGFGTVALSPDQTTITVNMRFSGLSAPASAAHIHGPAGAGTNASVLFGPFSGLPAATSGSIPEQSFAMTPTQVGFLTNGFLYMNVHNTNFPGGEIRGQLFLVPSVGTTFTNANGTYTDINGSGPQKFYRVTSP
jgi:hypothetical protein